MPRTLFLNDKRGQFPPSWYAATTDLPAQRPALAGDTRVDVAVVGAGYTGLWAAKTLAERGFRVAVLDAHRAGWGASGRNGGQVGSDFNKGQEWLERKMGRDAANALFDLSMEAVDMVRDFCTTQAPEARFLPGIVQGEYDTDLSGLRADVDHLASNYPRAQTTFLDREAMRAIVRSDLYHGGALNMAAGHVHPLRYVIALARAAENAGATIYEMTEVQRIDTGPRAVLHTDHGQVTADHVILAGNGYLQGLEAQIDARVMPVNSFIGATPPLGDLAHQVLTRDVAAFDSSHVVNYFRLSEDGRLLFGGRANYSLRFPADMQGKLLERMHQMFPQLSGVGFTHVWGGTLGITMTRLPLLRKVGPNVLSASGYSGHGVALAGLAGKVAAEAIAGQAARFDTLSALPVPPFPLGPFAQGPMVTLAMLWFGLRDKIGI